MSAQRRAPGDLLVHLRRARDHADRHYAEPLDLEALAAVAGISKYHFQRLFTATYGVSPAGAEPRPGTRDQRSSMGSLISSVVWAPIPSSEATRCAPCR